MRNFIKIICISFLAFVALQSCTIVPPGYEGVKVNLFGSKKGVDDCSLVTGRVFFNPVTTEVYKFPTYVQTVDYNPFTVNAKDGSEFTVDPTVSLKVVDTTSPVIFKKYRKPVDEIINTTIYNYVMNAFRIQLNKFTTDEIVSKREEVELAIEAQLRDELLHENFILEQFTSGLKYPQSIVEAVNAKNKAIQESQRAVNELEIVKAEAQKKIVAAQAEYEANMLKSKALTPQILEQMWIEKWSGNVPEVVLGNNTSTFLDLSKIRK